MAELNVLEPYHCFASSLHPRSVDELRQIERLVDDDEAAAKAAFDKLAERVRPFLGRSLADLMPIESDRQDVIQITLERIWAKRLNFKVQSIGAWWAYVAVTARRCALDRIGANVETILEDIPTDQHDYIAIIAEFSAHRSRLYSLADELWLGTDSSLPKLDRKRRLLAAQLHYLHDQPWEETCAIVGVGKPIAREELDSWLLSDAVLNDLSYSQLHKGNERLACKILGLDDSVRESEFDDFRRRAERGMAAPPEGWGWEEVRIVILRYVNGLLTEKIQQLAPDLSKPQIEAVLEKCKVRLPFEDAALELQRAFVGKNLCQNPLTSAGLWKRLVFQYFAAQELPQKQILERTQSAAQSVGYELTEGMVNVWLSGGRLIGQLISHARKGENHGL